MPTRLRRLGWTPTGRIRTPWRLVALTVLVIVASLAVSGAFLQLGVPIDPTTATGPALAAALLVLVGNGLGIAGATLLVTRFVDRRVVADVGLRFDGPWWRDLGVGLALGVALVGGAYVVGVGVGVYDVSVAPSAPTGYPLAVWLVLLALTMLVVGFYEELLLRGYVLTNLAEGFTIVLDRRGAVVAAVAASSLGFGLLHGINPNVDALGVATITVAGVLLGLAYVYTERLALPIGVHVTWNLTQALFGSSVSGLDLGIRLVRTETSGPTVVHGGAFGPEGGFLGLAAALVGCLVVVGYGRLTGRGFSADVALPALRRKETESSNRYPPR